MLTIGQVASRTGLRVSAIRYYEERGLLPKALRRSGKRVYAVSILERLAVIELAKMAGFGLDEIRATLSNVGESAGARWKTAARAKRLELDAERKRLMLSKYLLAQMSSCSCVTIEECGRAFLDALAKRRPEQLTDPSTQRRRSAKKLAERTLRD
jgi:MerR family transcriptional regulator, redox-sensitive transcriptional activator SoxR